MTPAWPGGARQWTEKSGHNSGHRMNATLLQHLPLSFHPYLLLHLFCSLAVSTVASLCSPWNTPEAALLWALALPVFSAWEVLLPSPSSLCSLQDRSLSPRTGVETRNMTIFRKPSDGEDGRLMSQNSHLKGIWTPVCFIEQRWGEVGLPRWHSGKEPTCGCRRLKRLHGSRRSPGVGKGSSLQYSCLEISWTEKPGELQSIGSQSDMTEHGVRGWGGVGVGEVRK